MKNDPAEASARWTRCLAARGFDSAAAAKIDWTAAIVQIRAQHLRATVHACLARADGLSLLPAEVGRELETAYRGARLEALAWQRALRLILPALRDAGIACVPYKGAALAFLVYADPAERSMSDIDLWIADADMTRACEVLETLGFVRRENPDRPVALQEHYDGEIPLQGHRLGVPLLELHWGVFPGEWLHTAADIDVAGIRSRLVPAQLFDLPVDLLDLQDHFLQVAAHAVISHQLGQAPVRCLLDLVRLADLGVDWETVVAHARRWQLAGVTAHACALAGALFDRQEFRDAAARLVTPARLRALCGFFDVEDVCAARKLGAGERMRYLLMLADRPSLRWRLVGRSLWPTRAWLLARYGRGRPALRLRHLAGALRGRF